MGPAVRVRVPATSANLGPGFDTLGLALGLHDELTARIVDEGLSITVHGEGAAAVAVDESHLVVRSMRTAFQRLGITPPGLALQCTNVIPHARGLGSSAAAIVAGVLLARGLAGAEPDPDAELRLACTLEGHPDNVAACLRGGLTIAWSGAGGARVTRLECDPRVVPVLFVPPTTSSTAHARGALPARVPHGDAAFNAGRTALLVAALTGAPDLLLDATEDRLHQGYRAAGIPASATLVAALRADGVPAVVSGAGPTVLALTRDPDETAAAARQSPEGWTALTPAIDTVGAVTLHGG